MFTKTPVTLVYFDLHDINRSLNVVYASRDKSYNKDYLVPSIDSDNA